MNGKDGTFRVEKGYYVPELAANLISVGALTEGGTRTVNFHQKGCDIKSINGRMEAQGDREGNMFKMRGQAEERRALISSESHAYLWHKRLGHAGGQAMRVLIDKKMAT